MKRLGIFLLTWIVAMSLGRVVWAAPSAESRLKTESVERDLGPADLGFQLTAGHSTLGTQQILTRATPNYQMYSIYFQADFQPLHTPIGDFGAGGSAAYHPTTSDVDGVEATFVKVWSFGGQARYQLRFQERQLLVPTAAYAVEQWSFVDRVDQIGSVSAHGPLLGLGINLGMIDGDSQFMMEKNTGFKNAYLMLEMRALKGSAPGVSLEGQAYTAGVRLEI